MVEKKSKQLLFSQKLEIVEYQEKFTKITFVAIARTFSHRFRVKISERTVKNIIDSKENVIAAVAAGYGDLNRVPVLKYDIVDEKLFEWVLGIEKKGGFITDDLLKKNAQKIAETENILDFKYSSGWLYKFKKRNKIKHFTLSGESFTVENQEDVIQKFKSLVDEKIKEYGAENIFNGDETGIFYRQMPIKSLLTQTRKGAKNFKDRVSIYLCVNMTGTEKQKPILIGKSMRPVAFRNFNFEKYIQYENNKKSWMTGEIFNLYLYRWDKNLIKTKRKICLFIDNCPCHKVTVDLKNLEVVFLPPNLTSKLQPLDAGIIRSFKSVFNNYKLDKISELVDRRVEVSQAFKSLNIKDAISFIHSAWKEITENTIQNCFKHAGFEQEIKVETEEPNNIEDEYNSFLKKIKIEDSATFKQYCDEDFNGENILFENTEAEENKTCEEGAKTSEEDQKTSEEISLIEALNSLSLVEKFVDMDKNFCVETKFLVLKLKKIFKRNYIDSGKGIKKYLIKLN